MHLDPYGRDGEVPRAVLHATLSDYGWQSSSTYFLSPASPWNLAMRTAHNIRAAFRSDLSAPHDPEPYVAASDTSLPASGASVVDRDAAVQAYLWVRLMLLPPDDMEWVQALHRLIDRFMNSWLGDIRLVEEYLVPMYDAAGADGQAWDDPRNLVRVKRQLDAVQPLAKGRGGRKMAAAAFRVGQVVRHRRLGFVAVVTGWADDAAGFGDDVVAQYVDGTDAYMSRVYYTCLYVYSFFPSLSFSSFSRPAPLFSPKNAR